MWQSNYKMERPGSWSWLMLQIVATAHISTCWTNLLCTASCSQSWALSVLFYDISTIKVSIGSRNSKKVRMVVTFVWLSHYLYFWPTCTNSNRRDGTAFLQGLWWPYDLLCNSNYKCSSCPNLFPPITLLHNSRYMEEEPSRKLFEQG